MIETWPQAVFFMVLWLTLLGAIVNVVKIIFERPPIDEFDNR